MTTALLLLFLAVAALLAYAAPRPANFTVRREIAVAAPPEAIFPFVTDFRQWALWSPYEKLDPAMQRTFGGAPSGKGAIYGWSGTGKAGAGRMEITDAPPSSRVTIKLDFIKPFEGHNIATISFEPAGGATRIVWAMEGPSPFMMKLMGIFLNLDQMIGRDFETGLANLKAVAEAKAQEPNT